MFTYPWIQIHDINVLYRFFTLLHSVIQPHGLGAPAAQGVSGSEGQPVYLRVFRELKLPLHLHLIIWLALCVPNERWCARISGPRCRPRMR